MAATMNRYAPVSALALVFLSMAPSLCPLPPLEAAERRHQAADGDRDEVHDVTGDDLAARERREASVEADEGDHVPRHPRADDVVREAQEREEHEHLSLI